MSQRENSSPEKAQREAASILKQVERDSQSIVLGGLPSRATEEPTPDDAMELWGRKIGRVLAVLAAVVAVIWLLIKLD